MIPWRLAVHPYVQWCVPWRQNWVDFTFVHLGCEWSPYKDSAEIQIGLLGINLVLQMYKKKRPSLKLVRDKLDAWKASNGES